MAGKWKRPSASVGGGIGMGAPRQTASPRTISAPLIGLPAGSVTRPRTMMPRFIVKVAVPLRSISVVVPASLWSCPQDSSEA